LPIKEDATFTARTPTTASPVPTRAVARQADGSTTRSTLNVYSPPARIEVEDDFFNHDSAVMMPDTRVGRREADPVRFQNGDQESLARLRHFHPDVHHTLTVDPPDPPAADDESRVGGLGVLAATYRFLALNPSFKLLLAGHCDTTGEDDYNFTLSERRAKNVLFLLQGDRRAWVKSALEHSQVEDQKRICKYAARERAWPCDPGVVDNHRDDALERALRAFRENYNRDFDRDIRVTGPAGEETWGAFFDVYMDDLATILDTTVPGLGTERAHLRFVDDQQKLIACGEKLPIEGPQRDDFRSEENRRVEVLFFRSSALPDLHCHAATKPFCMRSCGQNECGVYAPELFAFVPIDPAVLGVVRTGTLEEGKFEIVDSNHDLETLADKPDDKYTTRSTIRDVDSRRDPWAFLESFEEHDPDHEMHEVNPPESGSTEGA
jgi:hypothetical protein